MQKLFLKDTEKIDKARSPWAVCKGPGAAFVATCRRLGCKVIDAVTLTTDDGKLMQLQLDSPAAVANQDKLAVKRWRWSWRNLERTLPPLAKAGNGAGALMSRNIELAEVEATR